MKLELEKRLEVHTPESKPPSEDLPDCSSSIHPAESSTTPDRPMFHFNSELVAVGENSCSSDMTDSSSSSGQSEDSESAENAQREQSPLDVDENGLTRILSFSDTDSEDCSVRERNNNNNNCDYQQKKSESIGYGIFSTTDDKLSTSQIDNSHTAMSELLDENANQANALFHSSFVPPHALALHRSLGQLHGLEPLIRIRPGVLWRLSLSRTELVVQLLKGVRTRGQLLSVPVAYLPQPSAGHRPGHVSPGVSDWLVGFGPQNLRQPSRTIKCLKMPWSFQWWSL